MEISTKQQLVVLKSELSLFFVVSHILSGLVANPKKTTLHSGQSRSWSAAQEKKKKKEKV